jgi:hypothetical protein
VTNPTHKPVVIALAALALFAILVAARWAFVPTEHGVGNVQRAYDSLASALEQQKLLPLASEDEARAGLAALATTPGQLQSGTDADGNQALLLGQVIVCQIPADTVTTVELRPQAWRDLAPGALRDALSKLSRIPLERQAGKNPPGMALPTYRSQFDFTCTIGAQKFVFTPGFDAQQKLAVIGVRLASS